MEGNGAQSPLMDVEQVRQLFGLRNRARVYYLARPGGPLAAARLNLGRGCIRFRRADLERIIAEGGTFDNELAQASA